MSKATRAAMLVSTALLLSGCGTIGNLSVGAREGWKNAQIYGGVRRDVKSATDFFSDNWSTGPDADVMQDVGSVVGVGLVGLDVVFSAVADTLTLPITIPTSIWGSSTAPATVRTQKQAADSPPTKN